MRYDSSMKVKTSITLSEDVLKSVKRVSLKGESRSEAIERLLRERLVVRKRQAADQRDLEIINRHADRLNTDAGDVLDYQVDL
jgi:metal-responsive CopG/Arc/MetJ family transcriptional regulator